MSANTKIVVLHRKELFYTGVFALLGILFLILMIVMFLSKNEADPAAEDDSAVLSQSLYIPGIYTTELLLGNQAIDVEVIVGYNDITSIRLVNLSETVTTMYPLLQPTFESICEQVYELQTLEGVVYSMDSKYTSLVLLEAMSNSLEKAKADKEMTAETK